MNPFMATRSLRTFPVLLVGTLIAGCAGLVQAATPAARQALEANPDLAYAPDSVLVRFAPGTPPNARAEARRRVSGEVRRMFEAVPGLEHVLVAPGQVEKAIAVLQTLPNVLYAEPDYVRHISGTIPNDPRFGSLWGLHNSSDNDINAPEAWDLTVGSGGVIVADIDSGVDYNHPDLNANIWINAAESNGAAGVDDDGNGFVDDVMGWDFYSDDADPMDEHGHGTHTSGTIGAVGNNGIGIVGVAWHVKIMAMRFLGPNGSGYTSDAVGCLNYAVMMGARASNNSWGGGGFSSSLYDAISRAGQAGHLFVAAAGNDGTNSDGTPHYPSSYALGNVLSVAAVNANFSRASFSNYGATSVDLGAPGTSILSTTPNNGYASWNGTSMATPHVTGVAALLYDLNPQWGYLSVRDTIMGTVRPVASMQGVTVSGGVLDAAAAILPPDTPPVAPTGLSVLAVTESSVELAWTDHANTEQGFDIERSEDAVTWTLVGNVGPNTTTFIDGGLQAGTLYAYRVSAYNVAGSSAHSNLASATTDEPPTEQNVLASGEYALASGSVSGTYLDTHADDGNVEAITEGLSGGKPSRRHSYLEHQWTFSNVGSGTATFYANAYAPVSADGDRFVFSYSTDGVTFSEMLTVTATADGGAYQTFALPSGTRGTVTVRVSDTDRTQGHQVMDTVYVDHLFIRNMFVLGDPPAAPSALMATATGPYGVDLAWADNSDNELGFTVERSADGGASWGTIGSPGVDVTSFGDEGLQPLTTYGYRVQAYNASGVSAYCDVVSVTTADGLSLSALGYKVKSARMVDLSWSGPAVDSVDIYRNGAVIATVADANRYTDPIDARGTFTYQVCETGNPENCSNQSTVSF